MRESVVVSSREPSPSFIGDSLDDLLHQVFDYTLAHGHVVGASKGKMVELVGARLELTNPRARLSRTKDRGLVFSALGEFVWYLAGSESGDFIRYYIPRYDRFVVDGVVEGAYGPRLFGVGPNDQIRTIIRLLGGARASSRRAVVQLFDRHDLVSGDSEVPCTCVMQFLVRDDRLNLIVYMRSNDLYMGLPHDVFAFTMLQELVAVSLGVELGDYIHMVGSLHIYDDDAERAAAFLKEGFQNPIAMPSMPRGDPWAEVDTLLAREVELRTDASDVGFLAALGTGYWDDIARLLLAKKSNDPIELAEIEASLAAQSLAVYIRERLQKQIPEDEVKP